METYTRVDLVRPFPEALYEMVNDPSTDSIISWSESGKSLIVWNESEFCRDILPRYLLIRKFSSFNGMLDCFSIRKVEESDHQLEFTHDSLVRGKPELANIQNFVLTTPPSLLKVMERAKKRALDLEEKEKKKKKKKKMEEQVQELERFDISTRIY